MKAQRDLEKKIKQKQEEVQQLKEQLYKAESYLEGLQESLRLIQKDENSDDNAGIRPGSMVDKAREILRQSGKPMHVAEILKLLGKEVNKKTKASLSGSLGSYVRDGYIFTRPAPNTFGLVEFEKTEEDENDEPPEGFGFD